VFPDDRISYANELGYLDPFLEPEESEAATERIGAVWVEDVIFALDQLERLNTEDDLLAGHLDLERVGSFGHSFGGGTAVQAAYTDSRFQAVINLDGPLFGSVEGQALSQPLMVMLSTEWVITDEAVAAAGITREEYEAVIDGYIDEYTGQIMSVLEQTSPAYLLRLAGMAHVGFATDDIFFAPLVPEMLPPSSIGSLPAEYAVELISAYTTAPLSERRRSRAADQ
jgi:dienelactone hydrolase